MKSKIIITGICITLLGGSYSVANEGHDHSADKGSMKMDHGLMIEDHGMMQHEETGNESDAVEVGNKICPVSGEKVGEMGEIVKVEHNGKIYNLCCAMCAKDFKEDPEKYVKIVEEEMKQYEEGRSGHDEESEEGHEHEAGGHDHDHGHE